MKPDFKNLKTNLDKAARRYGGELDRETPFEYSYGFDSLNQAQNFYFEAIRLAPDVINYGSVVYVSIPDPGDFE
jgi:hypothetical protein